jgi:proline iminopeptidase
VTLYARSVGGPGSVIVAVHGGPGFSSHYLETLPDLPGSFIAGPKRTFVTYDQRGGGRSTKPQSNDYAFARHVEDLEALRTFFEADKLHLFGHSWGAVITMAYAIDHPDRVGSLIFFGGCAPTSDETNAGIARHEARVAKLQTEGIIVDPLPPPDLENDSISDMVRATVPAYFSDPHFTPPAEFDAMSFSPSLNQANLDAQLPFNMTSQLNRLELPVLILFGQDDPFGIEWARANEAAFSAADVSLVLLPGCGHFWHECWNETRAALESFLETHAGPLN